MALLLDPPQFAGANIIDWFPPGTMPGQGADLHANAYQNQNSGVAVTVTPAEAGQSLVVFPCDSAGLGFPCNLVRGTGVLLVSNGPVAPLRLVLSQGVQQLGAFVVAQAPPGTTIVATMWAFLAGAQQWMEPANRAGLTGGPLPAGASTTSAPFLGLQAPAGDRISAVYFDCVHNGSQKVPNIGIGRLYFL